MAAFGNYRLKKETIAFLKMMKHAFEVTYNKPFTNDEFIKQMAASVEDGDVAVWEMFATIEQQKEELEQKAETIRRIRE